MDNYQPAPSSTEQSIQDALALLFAALALQPGFDRKDFLFQLAGLAEDDPRPLSPATVGILERVREAVEVDLHVEEARRRAE